MYKKLIKSSAAIYVTLFSVFNNDLYIFRNAILMWQGPQKDFETEIKVTLSIFIARPVRHAICLLQIGGLFNYFLSV